MFAVEFSAEVVEAVARGFGEGAEALGEGAVVAARSERGVVFGGEGLADLVGELVLDLRGS